MICLSLLNLILIHMGCFSPFCLLLFWMFQFQYSLDVILQIHFGTRQSMNSWLEDRSIPTLSFPEGAEPREPVDPANPPFLSQSMIRRVRVLRPRSLRTAHSVHSVPLLCPSLLPCIGLPCANGPQHDAEVALLLPEVADHSSAEMHR